MADPLISARGTDGRVYPWGSQKPVASLADYDTSKKGRPDPVGSYPQGRGPFGHLDLAGSVWEWCLDAWDKEAYAQQSREGELIDPVITGEGDPRRVLRGGCWDDPAVYLRAAVRLRIPAVSRYVDFGFRLAAAPPSP